MLDKAMEFLTSLPGKAMELLTPLGVIPLAAGAAVYLFYCLSVFVIGRKTDTGGSLLAFVPGINLVWPLVGAANKSKIWILLTLLLLPLVSLYLWMLVAGRFGRSKVLGLLFALIVFVPLLNLLFVKLVFKEAGAAGAAAAMGFGLPEFPEEMPELPEVPGMEALGEEAPAEELFGEGFGEEEPKEEAPAEEPAEDDFAGLMDEGEAPAEFGEEEETGERAPTLEDMGFGEEAEEAPVEEAAAPEDVFEEAPAEEAFEFGEEEEAAAPEDVFEEAPAEEAVEFGEEKEAAEKAAPHEGAEAWEFPEEEPLEYEAVEEEMEAGMLPPAAVGAGLMGIGKLFGRTWEMFKVIAAVAIFAFAGAILSAAIESMRQGLIIGTVVVATIAVLIASAWGNGALVFAVSDEKLSVVGAYKKAWQKVGSFIWITILYLIVIMGHWILVIPGVILTVWFGFGLFILAKEDVRGMSALLKSKEYVSGHFGDVFLRWLVPFAFMAVYIAIRGVLNLASIVIPLVPTVVSGIIYLLWAIVIVPFIMLFVYHIYQDLRGLKGEITFAPSGGQKVLWLVLGIVGWIVGPIILAVLMTLAGMAFIAPLLMNMQTQF
jgi:hypothetical protein